MTAIRVKRRGNGWGVQERKGWFWRWVGVCGSRKAADGTWAHSSGALWFANLCERVDARLSQRMQP